jgi:hypothetical protein
MDLEVCCMNGFEAGNDNVCGGQKFDLLQPPDTRHYFHVLYGCPLELWIGSLTRADTPSLSGSGGSREGPTGSCGTGIGSGGREESAGEPLRRL